MPLEVKIGDRVSSVRLLKRDNSLVTIAIDDRVYELDVEMVEEGIYSILNNGQSYNIEMIQGATSKNYYVNTFYNSYDIEIIDAQSKYQSSRNRNADHQGEKTIVTPMPGRVVRIPVKKGQTVSKGQTVIVISAMKMESEYKAPTDGVVKKVYVKEGDTIQGHQPLVEIE